MSRDFTKSRRKPRQGGKNEYKKDTPKGDVKYETLRMVEVEYGDGGFYECSKKIRKQGKQETPFFSIARGFYGRKDGARIVMESMTISASGDTVLKMADALMKVSGEDFEDEEGENDEEDYEDDY